MTRWSVVLSARDDDAGKVKAALSELCEAYWLPLYSFARRTGKSSEDAEDLPQAFFAKLIEKDLFSKADAERGRLRSFLLGAFKNFLADELECINKPDTPAVLNLHKRGVYPAGEESHRIEGFKVTDVELALTIGGGRVELGDERLQNLSSASIDLVFIHSGLTRLSRKGQTYSFNHFRDGDPDKNPIRWTAKVDLLTKEVVMVTPSEASESLLRTLLGTGNELNILNFSRPGANADIFITADEFYGSELAAANAHPSGYRFSRWLDQSFNEISNTNQVRISNGGRKRVYAIYERIGDLEAPEVEEFRVVETEGNIVTYEVVFSEDVIGVDITDFAVDGGAPGAAVRSVAGTGRIRLVKVDLSAVPATAMTLSLLDDDSILDRTGNSLSGDGKGNGNQAAAISGTGGNTLTLSNLRLVDGLFQFTLRGKAGTEYRIESSTTLEGGWAFEEEFTTNGLGTANVIDATPPSGRKFYRAVERP